VSIPESIDDALMLLSQRAFAAFNEATASTGDCVVRPAVPILWFGDVDRYLASPVRVVTVALNPSLAEFPAESPFNRFRSAASIRGIRTGADYDAYRRALWSYFLPTGDPYTSWFASLEPLLNGMGASFYGGLANTALHTDMCSPVATNPTWSRLVATTKANLIGAGRPLWHDLIRVLRPHVMLVSVAQKYLTDVSFTPVSDWLPVHTIERENPYVFKARRLQIDDDHVSLTVFGRAAQKPFGHVSNAAKGPAGAAILGAING
jgi:hypothetical protein